MAARNQPISTSWNPTHVRRSPQPRSGNTATAQLAALAAQPTRGKDPE